MTNRLSSSGLPRLKVPLEDILTSSLSGEPQRGRPYDESRLISVEKYIKKCYPTQFVKRWEKLWREWEEVKITSTAEFWDRWKAEMTHMINYLPLPMDHSHQPMSDHFVPQGYTSTDTHTHIHKRLERIEAIISDAECYIVVIAQVASVIYSHTHLSQQRRYQMAETLSRVQYIHSRSLKKISDEIAALRFDKNFPFSNSRYRAKRDYLKSQLETVEAILEMSQAYVPVQITQVVDLLLKSEMSLSRQIRHQMAQTLSGVEDILGRSFEIVDDGIAALLKAANGGLLPETKGCKAESFEEISPLSTDDLALKAYSKGDHFVSELETMKATLEESQSYAPVRIAQVADVLKSRRHLSRQRRHHMAKTLSRVQDTLGRGFMKVGDGITALLKAVKNGLLPETKGYKALQENFAEFLQGISHLSTLHDLAVKAYSKGLISENAKNEAFATGIPLATQANNFLGLIQTRIKRDPKAYDAFLDILKSEPAYGHLVPLAGGG